MDEAQGAAAVVSHREQAVLLAYLGGTESHTALAAEFGYKTTAPIRRMLRTSWATSMIARARQAAEQQILAKAVPAQMHLRNAASRMARIVTEMAEVADQKPRDRAEIAIRALEYAGEKPMEKKVVLSLEAKLGELSIEELEAFVNGGVLPDALRHELDITPAAGDDAEG